MDDLGFNKIAAAVLVTALGFMFIKEVPHLLMHSEYPDVPAYALETPEDTGGVAVVEVPFPSPEFIAAMDATDGAKIFKRCTSCHNADNGGANGTGPNLYGIVGKAAGQKSGFGYSSAMNNSGITWNYEELNDFLTKPSKYLSGTAMNYIGLKKEEQRAAVIEYLRQQANTPMAQPVVALPVAAALPDEIVIEEPPQEGVPQPAEEQ